MSERIPRKFKKACKTYRNDVPLKTKWLRYVHTRYSVDWFCMEHEDMFESKEYLL